MTANYTPPPYIYSRIAQKVRRATRRDTGMVLTYDEVVALLHSDFYPILAEAERKELIDLHMQRQLDDNASETLA